MKTLSVHAFQQHWAELENRYAGLSSATIYVGYSGGLDSTVLAHLLANTIPVTDHRRLCLLHVNHHLQAAADDWSRRCADYAAQLGLQYRLLHVDAAPTAEQSPEEAAREARYQAFSSVISADDFLLTAHHQDDQAETFLLQLMRGAGLAGLSAMPEQRVLGQGYLLRPLLDWSRQQLNAFAQQQSLAWVDDPSNLDTHYDRNFIRQQVMPLLRARWPAVSRVIQRSAGHCASAQSQLDQVQQQILAQITTAGGNCLRLDDLLERPQQEVISLLHAWCRQQGVDLPSRAQLERVFHDVLHAAADRQPCVEWGQVSLRRYRHRLYLLPRELPLALSGCYQWQQGQSLDVKDWGRLEAADWPETVAAQTLQVCFRSSLQHKGHAKQWFQRYDIPPWQRDRTLFVIDGEKIITLIAEPRPGSTQQGSNNSISLSDQ